MNNTADVYGKMTLARVRWFPDLFDELGITAWVDGGWGVDALLGIETRPHEDLDIVIPTADSVKLVEALLAQGFHDVITDDRSARNFVMGHTEHGLTDFHVVEHLADGGVIYGPGEIDWQISAPELDGKGSIGGRAVRCLSVEYQVRSHFGYTLGDTDFADMNALRRKFGVALLEEQISHNG